MNKLFSKILFSLISLLVISCFPESKDQSLTNDEYISLGLPVTDSTWGLDEYKQCVEILNQIKNRGTNALPRLLSKKSGTTFQRMVSTENIAYLYKGQEMGAYQMKDFLATYNDLIFIYLETEEEFYQDELTSLLIFLPRTSDYMFSKLKTLTNVDFSTPEALNLLKQMTTGYQRQIVGLLELQSEVAFSTTNSLKLNRVISESLTNNLEFIDSAPKSDIGNKISSLLEEDNSKELKLIYSELLTRL